MLVCTWGSSLARETGQPALIEEKDLIPPQPKEACGSGSGSGSGSGDRILPRILMRILTRISCGSDAAIDAGLMRA